MKELIKDLNIFNNKKVKNNSVYLFKILLTAVIVYFVSLLVAEGLIIGGSFLFGYDATDNQLPQNIVLLCSFYGYIVTILFFILFTKKINKDKLDKIGLDKNFKPFFKGLLIGIIILVVIMAILILTGAVKYNGINNVNWLFIVLYFFAYLIQASMEELVTRGYLLHRLKERIPLETAIALSIIFFTVSHLSKLFEEGMLLGIFGVANLLLISLIWTYTTLKDKNIYAAIGFHFIWDFTLFSVIGLNLSGIDVTNSIFSFDVVNTFITGGGYGIEASFITTIISLIVFLFVKKNVKLK